MFVLSESAYGGQKARRAPAEAEGGDDRGREEKGIETFCTQLETRVDFSYFFARNPLKNPDSDE
jgi:hypothetical protein